MLETFDEQSLKVQHVIFDLWFPLFVICNNMRLNFQSALQIELQLLKSQASVHQPGRNSNPVVCETLQNFPLGVSFSKPKERLVNGKWTGFERVRLFGITGTGLNAQKGAKMLPFFTSLTSPNGFVRVRTPWYGFDFKMHIMYHQPCVSLIYEWFSPKNFWYNGYKLPKAIMVKWLAPKYFTQKGIFKGKNLGVNLERPWLEIRCVVGKLPSSYLGGLGIYCPSNRPTLASNGHHSSPYHRAMTWSWRFRVPSAATQVNLASPILSIWALASTRGSSTRSASDKSLAARPAGVKE